ncbi:alkaline phosphatase family protein [Nocardioides sp. zg-DK7169]|uniref:alkaline phosphatase family protein n=1 Tax=Nocardioides sp. zg-DK7169 TaxID=2736600 RepID=UPI001553D9EB|nr:alkaline phosphatase family protein [Nocardioides sp. zg-DK7169]NPC95952.1 hypothetical protein [Nocardioides sp. zg-DK7169]
MNPFDTVYRPALRPALAALALLLVATGLTLAGAGEASAKRARLTEQPAAATVSRVATFNVLGHGHTTPKGNKPHFDPSGPRMTWAVQAIEAEGAEVVGFQEFERPQYNRFAALRGSTWSMFPAASGTNAQINNTIAWRKDRWSLVSGTHVNLPYFGGQMLPRPLVLLRHVETGQLMYVFNTHNPASTRGPAQHLRDRAVRLMIKLVNDLRAQSPEIPVVVTGDMNDKPNFFCPFTAGTGMVAANGGSNVDGVCTLPPSPRIDWVLGTPDAPFTGYRVLQDALVRKASDHPLISALVNLPAPAVQENPVERVVVIDVEGLTSRGLRKAGAAAPHLQRMQREGAFTFNARTAVERITGLPNLVSMVTGRRVKAQQEGHGVIWNRDTGTTVQAASGRYVSSTFDLVHNFGLRTALLSTHPRTALIARSWDAANGGADPYGVDNGRAKIDLVQRHPDDAALGRALAAMLAGDAPEYTVAHLGSVATAGRAHGWHGKQYQAALTRVDRSIGTILDTIAADERLRTGTVVVVTSDSGAQRKPGKPLRPVHYKVPLLVWGSNVVPGAELYSINPGYVSPGNKQVGYGARTQPIRTGMVANLANALLRLPAIPGSRFNANQAFNVFVAAR